MRQNKPSDLNIPSTRKYRRRRKFIRRDLQLKIIFGTIFVAFLVLVFNFQVPIVGLWVLRETSQYSLDGLYSSLTKLLLTSLGISFLLTVPLCVWIGIVFSFHFCGPIYRIKKYFEDATVGRWDETLRLRSSDDLHDVKEVINEFVSSVRIRVRSQHEALERVRELLKASSERELEREEVESILERLEIEAREFDRRLGPLQDEPETTPGGEKTSSDEPQPITTHSP